MADVATIGTIQERAIRHAEEASQQLQTALESRVAIEQAKGVVSENLQVDMGSAFALLRDHARRSNRRLTEVADGIITGYLSPNDLSSSAEQS